MNKDGNNGDRDGDWCGVYFDVKLKGFDDKLIVVRIRKRYKLKSVFNIWVIVGMILLVIEMGNIKK